MKFKIIISVLIGLTFLTLYFYSQTNQIPPELPANTSDDNKNTFVETNIVVSLEEPVYAPLVTSSLITSETLNAFVSLLNVNVDQENNKTVLLKIADNQQEHMTGDLLNVNGHVLELIDIATDRVQLSENGNIYTVELNTKYLAQLEVSAEEKEEEAINEMLIKAEETSHSVMDVMSFEPLTIDDQVFGLKIGPGAQENYFYDLGLLDGDIIISINKVNIGSSDGLFDSIQVLRDNDSVDIVVMRNEEKIPLTIKTEGYK